MKEVKISGRTIIIAVSCLVLLIVVLVIAPSMGSNEEAAAGNNVEINYDKLNDVMFTVKTATVKRGTLTLFVSGNGIVKPGKELEIMPNVSGYISRVNIAEGRRVKNGEMMIKLDDREQQLAVEQAKVDIINAKIDFNFFSRDVALNKVDHVKADSIKNEIALLEKKFSDKQIDAKDYLTQKDDLDLALIFTGAKRDEVMENKSGVAQRINAMNRAKLNLSYTEIEAPFDGIIADCELVPNQHVNSGAALCKLLDDSSFRIEVGLIESEIIHIKNGSQAKVMIPSIPGAVFRGKVVNINPRIDEETKTCRVTIEIPNTDGRIKSGMFANVLIQSETLDDRVLVPKEALLVRDNRNLVFTAEGEVAKWKYVDIGEQNEDYIEIKSGVDPEEAVIIEGQYNLAHDAKIKVSK